MEVRTPKALSGRMMFALVLGLVVAFALCCSGLFADDAYAASSKKKKAQHKKYEQTIKNYDAKMKREARAFDLENDCDYAVKSRTYFAFADIDKNGVDELIVRFDYAGTKHNTASDSGYNETTCIYTIKKGKVKAVIKHGFEPYWHANYVRIYKGSNYIDCGFSHGYEDLQFHKYSKGKLSKKTAYWMCYVKPSSSTDGLPHYSINEREVTKKQYNAQKKKLKKSGKGYTLHAYNPKTFKKYI